MLSAPFAVSRQFQQTNFLLPRQQPRVWHMGYSLTVPSALTGVTSAAISSGVM